MALFRRGFLRRQSKLAQRRRKMLMFKITGGVLLVVFLVGFSSWLAHRPEFQITKILIQGNEVVSKSDIESTVREKLSGKYFFLFPKTNIALYPRNILRETLFSLFTRLKEISLSREGLTSLVIQVVEQSPYALWCTDMTAKEIIEEITAETAETAEEEKSLPQCYFLNDEGFIYTEAPNFTGNVFFRFYNGVEEENPIRKIYLRETQEFNRAVFLIDSIKRIGLVPVEMRILKEGDIEIYMENGSKILLSLDDSFSQVLENLKLVLNSDAFTENQEEIDYIDLRFGNKIYYKLK